MEFSHLNEAWAYVLVDRLHRRHGVQDFCIAPGSRSAPLALAAARYTQEYPAFRLHTHFDERGLAFLALGLIQASGRPVAVLTTSGTAVANLHPAMIEAFESHRPLIALTADRPPEMLDCGANQTIHQQGLFGRHVRGELRLPAPEQVPDPGGGEPNWSWSRACLCRQLDAVLDRLHGVDRGPVHLNVPFREPLYPTAESQNLEAWWSAPDTTDRTTDPMANPTPNPATGRSGSPRGRPHEPKAVVSPVLLVAGQLEPAEAASVLALAQRCRIPLLADIGSQLRLVRDPYVVDAPDLLLASPAGRQALEKVRQVIQFGGRLTGKRINQWLANFAGPRWLLSPHTAPLDPTRRATLMQADIPAFCARFTLPAQQDLGFTEILQGIQAQATRMLQETFSELSAVRVLSAAIPARMALLAGNSLSIRLLDTFARPMHGNRCLTSRGASGIDGLLATATGFSRRHPDGLTLLLGDLSLLHDLNSLALAARSTVPLVIVVLNNDGGGIFNLLPAREQAPWFESLFQCPHGLDFRHAAAQFGLGYRRPESAEALRAAYAAACVHAGATVIELNFPATQSAMLWRRLVQRLDDPGGC